MKKRTLRERISYQFDCMMSKGPIAMTLLLFAITAAIVGTIGICAYFVSDDGGIFYQIWNSMMHALDAGNLAGAPMDNGAYLILMILATLCGLFLTSILIGIIATGVEDKLNDLRKGVSVVQEDDHTVIIGFNNDIYTILRELICANANKKDACIVILGDQPKEEMEEAVASHICDSKTTRIICRSGSLHEDYILERCSVETCRSVIINVAEDALTVKIILALTAYLRDKDLKNPDLKYVASLQDSQYVEPARIAGEGRATIISAKDAIARIVSNTCRQHGLSQVLTELFSFSGNELYFEQIPELAGKTFQEAVLSFSNAVAIGLYTGDQVQLNPPMQTRIGQEDQLVLLEMDDGEYACHPAKQADPAKLRSGGHTPAKASSNLLILGSNEKLPVILAEYTKYVSPGTRVVIVDDDADQITPDLYDNLDITICPEAVTRGLLCSFLNEQIDNILLLNDDSHDPETSDALTLLRLILLRDIADKTHRHFSITTEMRSVDNQRLATQARVDDFVIGSNFASLMLAQISENPRLVPLIDDLLDESGSELYMKPAADYVVTGTPVDSYTLTESAARRGEVYLGYRHVNGAKTNVILNPPKDAPITFGEQDLIVVIAEN